MSILFYRQKISEFNANGCAYSFQILEKFLFKVQMQTQLHLTQGSVILSRNLTIDTIHCNPDLMKSARNTGLNFRYQQDSKTRRLGKKAQVWQCVYIKSFFSIIQIKCFKIRSSSLSAVQIQEQLRTTFSCDERKWIPSYLHVRILSL